ncbi:MAG: phosphoribosylpyrophosphate synthetase [Sphingobacteriaceae bacterium]
MSVSPKKYQTMTEAVNALAKRGYTYDFQYEDCSLYCKSINHRFRSNDLLITEVYRFEGMSDPDDNSAVYAIESKDGFKGILIDAYGVYSDEQKALFLKDIPVKECADE